MALGYFFNVSIIAGSSNLDINPELFHTQNNSGLYTLSKNNIPVGEPNQTQENTTFEKFQRYTGTGAPLDNNLPKNSDNPNNNNNTATINSPYIKFIPPQLRKNSPNIGAGIAVQENRTNSNIKISHNTTTNVSPITSVNLDTADEVKDFPQMQNIANPVSIGACNTDKDTIPKPIPIPPPLPSKPLTKMVVPMEVSFSNELEEKIKDRGLRSAEIQQAFLDLEKKVEAKKKLSIILEQLCLNISEEEVRVLIDNAEHYLETPWTTAHKEYLNKLCDFLKSVLPENDPKNHITVSRS